jgi:predicted helicase
MTRLVHDALKTRFKKSAGLAAANVTIADPAVGTGTFLIGILKQIADAVTDDEGEGQVPAAIEAAINRLIAFEMQLGPFAVAQLRMTGEIASLTKNVSKTPLRMYVTDTLGNPYVEMEETSALVRGIAESRRQANEIKKNERITVVIGNPPYKEKAKGKGGWIESGGSGQGAPLNAWKPPADWGVGAHVKHLSNLYVYFWRWATWKVFDHNPQQSTGVVCFITVAGFLNGPGFQKMRATEVIKGRSMMKVEP